MVPPLTRGPDQPDGRAAAAPALAVDAAYTAWAASYDRDPNRTRDLDAEVARQLVGPASAVVPGPLGLVVEAGCGTGKNTVHYAALARRVLALDFSAGMLDVARARVAAPQVQFAQADLQADWPAAAQDADLVCFHLVLEHMAQLAPVLARAARALRPGGHLLVSELHPFKQYLGGQARFQDPQGREQRIPAHVHHVSDYTAAAQGCGLQLLRLDERWHADDDPGGVPRLLCLVLRRTP